MGTYCYRVTAKRVKLTNGEEANIATFAYKPTFSWDRDGMNNKWHFRSGATASDRLAEQGKLTPYVVFGHKEEGADAYELSDSQRVFRNVQNQGSFFDSGSNEAGGENFPRVPDLACA